VVTDDAPDAPEVHDEWGLLRRIPPWHFTWEADGAVRPSGAAFDDDQDGNPMSVVVAEECAGLEKVLEGHEGFALVRIPVGVAKEKGQRIVLAPTEAEPAHALVVGKKTKSVRRALARASEWVVPPPRT